MTNLIEIDNLVDQFLIDNATGIATMNKIYLSESGDISNRALAEEIKDELRTGCVTFFNKDEEDRGELSPYLFYITNAFCKKKAVKLAPKKKTEYVCPGCLFLGKDSLTALVNNYFRCEDCEVELKSTQDPKMVLLFKTFFKHNKNGYHCEDCDRFIPHPIDDAPVVSCPYLDCLFVGQWASLKRMHHPSSQSKVEAITLDSGTKFSCANSIADDKPLSDSQFENQETLMSHVKMLHEIIDSQKNNVPYSSSEATIKHKFLCYEAFSSILKKFPEEMVDYLLNKSRSGGFQSKIFQEYISLLEKSLPYSFKKNNKHYLVNSLLDENLSLFGGISEFNTLVSEKLEIKNNTQEYYIGGRKGAVAEACYIGKLLGVHDKVTKVSLMDDVVEYSFSKIKMKNIVPGTEVIVTHLRVPPHYQMGGMVYVNRVRKKIVDRAHSLLAQTS